MSRILPSRPALLILAALMVAVGFNAHATTIQLLSTNADFQGTIPNNPDADDVETITGTLLDLNEDYKDNVGGAEEGPFSSSYDTTFSNIPLDPEDALIEYVSGLSITGDEIYALAKDGNQDPNWYIWDISSWDGLMDLSFEDLWPAMGAISHVSIFAGVDGGNPPAGIPEPGALVLLATGLLGMRLVRRRGRQT